MFADIALKEQVAPLTYRVPTQLYLEIKSGSLVEVMFRGKKNLGVVVSLRKTLKPELKDKKILSISKIICTSWIGERDLNFAKMIAKFSVTPLGIVIFRLMPPILKRSLKELQNTGHTDKFSPSTRYHLYGSIKSRANAYNSIIQKVVSGGGQVMIVSPQNNVAKIATHLENPLAVEASSSAKTLRAYYKFQSGEAEVIVGSRKIAGWSSNNLKLIIVDDPLNLAHKDEQQPYLDTATIALMRKKQGVNIFLGMPVATPEVFFAEQNFKAKRIKGTPENLPIEIIELKKGLISRRAEKIIASGEQVFIIAPRKGLGGAMRCLDCDNLFKCNGCQQVVFFGDKGGFCGVCNQQIDTSNCQNCGGHSLQAFGIGTEAIAKSLKNIFGDLPANVSIITEGEAHLIPPSSSIIFSFSDAPLSSPNLNRPYRLLGLIKDLAAENHKVILQTKQTNSPWWQILANNPQALAKNLAERKQFNLSPYSKSYSFINPTQKLETILKSQNFVVFKKDDMLKTQVLLSQKLDLQSLGRIKLKAPSLL